jgi:hypothetical protein
MNLLEASRIVDMLDRGQVLFVDAQTRGLTYEAWHAGLSEVGFDEAKTAVADILRETTAGRRVTPGDIAARAARARERAARGRQTPKQPTPPNSEPPANGARLVPAGLTAPTLDVGTPEAWGAVRSPHSPPDRGLSADPPKPAGFCGVCGHHRLNPRHDPVFQEALDSRRRNAGEPQQHAYHEYDRREHDPAREDAA